MFILIIKVYKSFQKVLCYRICCSCPSRPFLLRPCTHIDDGELSFLHVVQVGSREGHRLVWNQRIQSAHSRFGGCCRGRMCYEVHKTSSSYAHPNRSRSPLPCVLWAHQTATLCRPSSARCTRLPFLVLSIHSWVWVAELAAILYGVTIKLFLTLFYGEAVGWVRRKLSAYTLLKILELSSDSIQQIVIKYKPEPELPLSSVSSSTKLSGIWDPL